MMNMQAKTFSTECPLTERHLVVIRQLADGMEYPEIATSLGCSTMGVGRRVWQAYDATGTYNRHGLVAMAFRKGWIQ